MKNKNEEWKDIKGFEGRYQVSNLGKVKSLGHYQSFGNGGMKWFPERILKGGSNAYGYEAHILCLNGKRKAICTHRLVAEAFIPNPDNLPQVNHIDENKKNNCVDNLEWVTVKQNINHGTSLAKRSYHQRFTQKQRKMVYQYDKEDNLIATYISVRDAARRNGFDRTGIAHCCNLKEGFKSYKGYKWRYENIKEAKEA